MISGNDRGHEECECPSQRSLTLPSSLPPGEEICFPDALSTGRESSYLPVDTHLLSHYSSEAALLLGSQAKSNSQRERPDLNMSLKPSPQWRCHCQPIWKRKVLIPHFEFFFHENLSSLKYTMFPHGKLKMPLSPLYWWFLLVFGPLRECLLFNTIKRK